MKKSKCIKTLFITLVCALALTTNNAYINKATAQPVTTVKPTVTKTEVAKTTASTTPAIDVLPLMVVKSPTQYLNKKVCMKAKFDKFSTLGLDYKPAFKSSEDYISFLIKRDDVQHDIPLSEMKLFLKRAIAEKNIDLKTNDEIKIVGTVFSDALGDAWIDVDQLTVTQKAPDKDGVK